MLKPHLLTDPDRYVISDYISIIC